MYSRTKGVQRATPFAGVQGVSPCSFFLYGWGGVGTKSNDECKSVVGLDTRHSLTYNERAHKQNIIYGCATAMIYLFSIALYDWGITITQRMKRLESMIFNVAQLMKAPVGT